MPGPPAQAGPDPFQMVFSEVWRQPSVYGWPSLPLPSNRIYLVALTGPILGMVVRLALRGLLRRRLVLVMMPALVAIELILYGWGYNPTIEPTLVFPETSPIRFLRAISDHGRILPMGNILSPNQAMIWGLQDIRAYEIIRLPRIWTLIRQMSGYVQYGHGHHLLFADASSSTIDLLGVRYVITRPLPKWPTLDPARYRVVHGQAVDRDGGSLATPA